MSLRRRPAPRFSWTRAGAAAPPAPCPQDRAPVQCVFVTGTPGELEIVRWLVAPWRIKVYRACSVDEARELLRRVQCRVLLSETEFAGGTWKDVLRMIQREHPETAVVLVMPRFDGQVWVEALEQGCYDVMLKPLRPGELRRRLEEAHRYAGRRLAQAPGRSFTLPVERGS
jgi:DNA-binding NtrC family response regulator